MKRWEAVRRVVDRAGDALIIHANGMISRESFVHRDRDENFYMIGSMELACSIGLGVAMSRPDRQVIVLDGDGNVLMNLGSLAMVGEVQPKNLIQVVLDNESYGSTGGQRSISNHVALEKFAAAAGYARVERVTTEQELVAALDAILVAEGPSFLLVKVEPGSLEGIGRVTHPPEVITERFARAMGSSNFLESAG
jgi:thiamine pyrophosphate-dependent acetolactate synthase large subunit-like protein